MIKIAWFQSCSTCFAFFFCSHLRISREGKSANFVLHYHYHPRTDIFLLTGLLLMVPYGTYNLSYPSPSPEFSVLTIELLTYNRFIMAFCKIRFGSICEIQVHK